ncbi:acetolactate synthase small subunit [Pseudofulvibacter geojedonensis]|uniref:Acetolactate synthase small subunit n=1 Tax=Pseudofulvibacter geojedonensis TaxID=1123758 RepID=A0ABW3I537_9FLAO
MGENKTYTISVYTENNLGVMNRISGIFLKRHINLESITASQSEIKDVFRFVFVITISEERVRKLVGQIEKQVEVLKAYYHTDEETIFQESALFKIATNLLFDDRQIQNIIKNSNANIVTVAHDYFVIEKTGRRHETEELYKQLLPFGILQFVRTGRISVTKEAMNISRIVKEFNY